MAIQNQKCVNVNYLDHKDLRNYLLKLCPQHMNHSVQHNILIRADTENNLHQLSYMLDNWWLDFWTMYEVQEQWLD
jgi:hypothetical protein